MRGEKNNSLLTTGAYFISFSYFFLSFFFMYDFDNDEKENINNKILKKNMYLHYLYIKRNEIIRTFQCHSHSYIFR